MALQKELVLKYMRECGEITQLDALREFGIMRLASRISDLKRDGYDITMTMKKGKNRYGDTTHFAAYSLHEHKRYGGDGNA